MSYTPTYRKRFPIQPKLPDGSWGCRGCGGPIPKGRYSWCSKKCVDTFEPKRVIWFVKQRDKGFCQLCGLDIFEGGRAARPDCWRWSSGAFPMPHGKPEYDHILPMCEGGLTVLSNMRTLCRPCHLKETKALASRRAKKP